MQINVLVEPLNGKGFRASSGAPFNIVAEGTTREGALDRLKEQVQARVNSGAEVVSMEVGAAQHPWMKFAGIFKDDPLFDEWQQAIQEYRDQVEKDDDYP